MYKTAFLIRYGSFEWVVLPMGLINALATFMMAMNNLLHDLLDCGLVVFLDDILVYSDMPAKHFELLEITFERLCKYKFYCKLKKCSFLK